MKTSVETRSTVDRQLALADFRAGFFAAMELEKGRRAKGRALLPGNGEKHWRAGYAAGSAAMRAACGEYEHRLVAGEVAP